VEAVQALTTYVLQHWSQVRMLCRIDSRNSASIRVAINAGYVCEKQETLLSDSGGYFQVQHYVLGR
jgi:RimJ/RimL family protein N-acetyltransferase